MDAKVSSVLQVALDRGGLVDAIEWDAGARPDVLHESATHLGLVVLDSSLTVQKMFDGSDVVLRGELVADGRVFLVPKEVARAESRPIWSTLSGRPGKGRFRYLPIHIADRYEVDLQRGPRPRCDR